MLRLRDHERLTDADDARRLAQDHLDAPRVLVLGELPCALGGLDLGQPDDTALRLGDDLLCQDDDVAILELDVRGDELRQVVARSDLGQALDRDDANLLSQGSP